MKKRPVIISVAVLAVIISAVLVLFLINNSTDSASETSNDTLVDINEVNISLNTQEINETQIGEYKSEEAELSQTGLLIDSWLKIISIGETDGVFSVVVRNTADFDVEYALLSVYCNGEKVYFPITTLVSGSTAILKDENSEKFNKNSSYVGWTVEEKTIFDAPLSLYEDVFEIKACDGLISVKNISEATANSIYVYYKNVENGVFTEGTTYRISIDKLESGEKIQLEAGHYNSVTSKVMFVDYVQ